MEISQDGNSLLGQLNPQGDSVLHINISFPPRPFPRALTGLSGGTLSPETERDSDKQTQEAESGDKNTVLHVHRFLFASTFHVRT